MPNYIILTASAWTAEHPILLLIMGIVWIGLLILFIRWILKIGIAALLFVFTFFLPFDFYDRRD